MTATCPTLLLDDRPAREALFESHRRTAVALAELLASGDAAAAVSVAGPYGSGKSTIVQHTRELLAGNANLHLFRFDAWAHRSDPLRRTFLERLVADLGAAGWIDESAARLFRDRLRVKLDRGRSVTRQRVTPTVVGMAIAGAAVFALNQLFAGDEAQLGGYTWFLPRLRALQTFAIPLATAALIAWWTGDRRAWSLSRQPLESETQSETVRAPEITSVEFEEMFDEVLAAVAGSRRLVIVFDNIDRVLDPEAAADLWSAMRLFIESTADRVWWVVPYDPDHTQDPSDRALIERVIDVQFPVAPPTQAAAHDYFVEQAARALPSHGREELSVLARLYATICSARNLSPTPRRIKRFLNDAGALHRQWCPEAKLSSIAVCAAYRDEIRAGGVGKLTEIVDAAVAGMLDETWVREVAAISHNVTPSDAWPAVVNAQIAEWLGANDYQLIHLLRQPHNPQAVAQAIEAAIDRGARGWATNEPLKLGRVAQSLHQLRNDGLPLEKSWELLCAATTRMEGLHLKVEEDLADSEAIEGFVQILSRIDDPTLCANIAEMIGHGLVESTAGDERHPNRRVRSMDVLLEFLDTQAPRLAESVAHYLAWNLPDSEMHTAMTDSHSATLIRELVYVRTDTALDVFAAEVKEGRGYVPRLIEPFHKAGGGRFLAERLAPLAVAESPAAALLARVCLLTLKKHEDIEVPPFDLEKVVAAIPNGKRDDRRNEFLCGVLHLIIAMEPGSWPPPVNAPEAVVRGARVVDEVLADYDSMPTMAYLNRATRQFGVEPFLRDIDPFVPLVAALREELRTDAKDDAWRAWLRHH